MYHPLWWVVLFHEAHHFSSLAPAVLVPLLCINLQPHQNGLPSKLRSIFPSFSDAVSEVHLTVVPGFSGLESCNVTVNCSTKDSPEYSINNTLFTCDNQHCSPEGGERPQVNTSTGFLSVYMSEDQKSIICNHSNPVSWRNDTTPRCQLDSSKLASVFLSCLSSTLLLIRSKAY